VNELVFVQARKGDDYFGERKQMVPFDIGATERYITEKERGLPSFDAFYEHNHQGEKGAQLHFPSFKT